MESSSGRGCLSPSSRRIRGQTEGTWVRNSIEGDCVSEVQTGSSDFRILIPSLMSSRSGLESLGPLSRPGTPVTFVRKGGQIYPWSGRKGS